MKSKSYYLLGMVGMLLLILVIVLTVFLSSPQSTEQTNMEASKQTTPPPTTPPPTTPPPTNPPPTNPPPTNPPPTNPPGSPPLPKQGSKSLLWLWILLGIVLLIGGGFLAKGVVSRKRNTEQPRIKYNPIMTPIMTPKMTPKMNQEELREAWSLVNPKKQVEKEEQKQVEIAKQQKQQKQQEQDDLSKLMASCKVTDYNGLIDYFKQKPKVIIGNLEDYPTFNFQKLYRDSFGVLDDGGFIENLDRKIYLIVLITSLAYTCPVDLNTLLLSKIKNTEKIRHLIDYTRDFLYNKNNNNYHNLQQTVSCMNKPKFNLYPVLLYLLGKGKQLFKNNQILNSPDFISKIQNFMYENSGYTMTYDKMLQNNNRSNPKYIKNCVFASLFYNKTIYLDKQYWIELGKKLSNMY